MTPRRSLPFRILSCLIFLASIHRTRSSPTKTFRIQSDYCDRDGPWWWPFCTSDPEIHIIINGNEHSCPPNTEDCTLHLLPYGNGCYNVQVHELHDNGNKDDNLGTATNVCVGTTRNTGVDNTRVTMTDPMACNDFTDPNWQLDVDCCTEFTCEKGGGECDDHSSNTQCPYDGGYCGIDNCNDYWGTNTANGWPSTWDCCLDHHDCHRFGTADWLPDSSCCADWGPCPKNNGHCTNNNQCDGSLICGDNNCAELWGENRISGSHATWNCCTEMRTRMTSKSSSSFGVTSSSVTFRIRLRRAGTSNTWSSWFYLDGSVQRGATRTIDNWNIPKTFQNFDAWEIEATSANGSPRWCPDSISVSTTSKTVSWNKDLPYSEGLCPYIQSPLDNSFNPQGHQYVTKFYWNEIDNCAGNPCGAGQPCTDLLDEYYCPTPMPTPMPSPIPSPAPTDRPSPSPTNAPTPNPTAGPTPTPTNVPTPTPTDVPSPSPTAGPTPNPTAGPTPNPTVPPTPEPTGVPTPVPTNVPTPQPTAGPTPNPTAGPTPNPTSVPTPTPTNVPTPQPTAGPTPNPTAGPTPVPTPVPTPEPTAGPTPFPTAVPTLAPGLWPQHHSTAPAQSPSPNDEAPMVNGSVLTLIPAFINEDDMPDLVAWVESDGRNSIMWYKNDGGGDGIHFSEASVVVPMSRTPCIRRMIVADVDGDTSNDVVVLQCDTKVLWYRNLLSGRDFANGRTILDINVHAGRVVGSRQILAEDLDQNGLVDFVVTSAIRNEIYVYLQNADASSGQTRVFDREVLSVASGQILDVQPGDLDSDMDLDLLVSSAYLVFWYENTGSTDGGLFNETHLVTLHGHDIHTNPIVRAIPLDISRDGTTDIVAHTGDKLVWYEHTDDAELSSSSPSSQGTNYIRHEYTEEDDQFLWYSPANGVVNSLDSGDFNNDGAVDIAVNPLEGSVKVFLTSPAGLFDSAPTIAAEELEQHDYEFVASADFDNDGDVDLVAVVDGGLVVFENELID